MGKSNEIRLDLLEKSAPGGDRVSWFEIVDGVIYSRFEDGSREVVTEVIPGYKVYDGISPDDWNEET